MESGRIPDDDVVALLAEVADVGQDRTRGGWSRHVFDKAELSMRAWFTRHSTAAGLAVETDRNGNMWAYWGRRGPGTIVVGSHLDSVPGGGAFDGPLGVASALAALTRLRAAGFVPARPVAIAVFAEEEGSRFGIACLGSKLATGAIAPDVALALRDAAGSSFAEVLASHGYVPAFAGRDDARLSTIAAFIELHIEQGRALADLGAPLAVATGILAHGRWRLTITGEGNHAGTTTMSSRRDPVIALAAIALAAERAARAQDDPLHGGCARATIGRVDVLPGGTNVIAGRVDAWLDVRAEDDDATRGLLERILEAAHETAEKNGCELAVVEESYGTRVTFDPELRDRVSALLGGLPALVTGAGHDAGVLGNAGVPTAMLFVRNPTGVSHAPTEGATDEDCRTGVDALATVLQDLAGQAP